MSNFIRLYGGTPAFDTADLHALALIRDSFGDHHPQAAQIHALLDQLTAGLRADERAQYDQRQRERQRTPAMAARLTCRRWTVRELLAVPLAPAPLGAG